VLSARRIGVLSRAAARLGVPVFLCGNADGQDAVWHLFDTVVALIADAPTLRQRITSRSDNHFGKAPEELAIVMRLQPGAQESYRRLGAVIIDAVQPLNAVVDQVLAATEQARTSKATPTPRSYRQLPSTAPSHGVRHSRLDMSASTREQCLKPVDPPGRGVPSR
jgi:hypothetical protein